MAGAGAVLPGFVRGHSRRPPVVVRLPRLGLLSDWLRRNRGGSRCSPQPQTPQATTDLRPLGRLLLFSLLPSPFVPFLTRAGQELAP